MPGIINVNVNHLMPKMGVGKFIQGQGAALSADATLYTVPTGFTLWVYWMYIGYLNLTVAANRGQVYHELLDTTQTFIVQMSAPTMEASNIFPNFSLPFYAPSQSAFKTFAIGSQEYINFNFGGLLVKDEA